MIVIEAGYVNTPILDKAEAEDFGSYRETDYGPILGTISEVLRRGRKKRLGSVPLWIHRSN